MAARIFENVALGSRALTPPGVSGASRFLSGKGGSFFSAGRKKPEHERGVLRESCYLEHYPGGGTGPKESPAKEWE